MPRTPDRRAGRLEEEEVLFDDLTADGDPTDERALRYNGGAFKAKDALGVYNLRDAKDVKVSSNDATVGFLIDKIVPSGDIDITEINDGGAETLELSVVVGTVFAADEIQAATLLGTTSTLPQDAFLGESPASLSPAFDGDYLILFEADLRVTNNNGIMAISIGKNSTTVEEPISVRKFEGNDRGSNVSIVRLDGLVTTDIIHGLFRKDSGPGTAEIRNRSMSFWRVA